MSEILFYHLTERTLEQTLPGLLEKCLERKWKTVVQCGSQERLEAIDHVLWTWRDDSFLAHSALRDGNEQHQPVFLTDQTDNPNGANVRFVVAGAEPPDLGDYDRGIYIFDGHDEAAKSQARERWKIEKAAGNDVTYWQQEPDGKWQKKA